MTNEQYRQFCRICLVALILSLAAIVTAILSSVLR